MMHVSREPSPFRSDTWALKGSVTVALAPNSNSFNKQNSHVRPKLGSCVHTVRVAGKWEDHRTDSPKGFVSEGFTLVSWCCNSSSLHIPFISQQGKRQLISIPWLHKTICIIQRAIVLPWMRLGVERVPSETELMNPTQKHLLNWLHLTYLAHMTGLHCIDFVSRVPGSYAVCLCLTCSDAKAYFPPQSPFLTARVGQVATLQVSTLDANSCRFSLITSGMQSIKTKLTV